MSTSYFLTLHIRKTHSKARIKKYIFTALSITFLDETGFFLIASGEVKNRISHRVWYEIFIS